MLPFFTDELVNPSVHLCPACLFLIALTVKETLCNSEKVTDYKTESHNTSLLQLHTCCSFACCWCNTLKMLQDQNQEAAKLRKVLKAAGEKFSAILSLLIVCSVMIKNTAVSVFHNPGWDCVCVCVCIYGEGGMGWGCSKATCRGGELPYTLPRLLWPPTHARGWTTVNQSRCIHPPTDGALSFLMWMQKEKKKKKRLRNSSDRVIFGTNQTRAVSTSSPL